MENYEGLPPKDFWKVFPSRPLPAKIEHSVNVVALESLVEEKRDKLSIAEKERAKKCISNFKLGADSFQKTALPSCFVPNSEDTVKYGEQITDTIALWTKKGFVAGPFESPPLSDFRVNPLMAIDQGEKIRPVLNASLPKDCSFNDNVNLFMLEKVRMSSARRFGFSVIDAGVKAKMSKFDLIDAYKNIPAKILDLRLQGFSWLSKFFVETTQIFGAKTAVSNFDIFGNSILSLACAESAIPKHFVHRTLDDVPIVAPANTTWCEDFTKNYSDICDKIGVKIAENCEKNEKAFSNATYGKVLGIYFNTENLSWKLPSEKRDLALTCIVEIKEKNIFELESLQVLLGRLNNIVQMCPFMKIFNNNMYIELAILLNTPNLKNVIVNAQCEKDMNIWQNFLCDGNEWLPVAPCYVAPPPFKS